MSNESELNRLFESVGYRRETHPVLVRENETEPLQNFLKYTLAELTELEEEESERLLASDEKHKKQEPSKTWWLEFTDFLVMLRMIRQRIAPSFSIEKTVFSVNGQYKGNFDSLKDQTINLAEGNPEHNLKLIFTELLSLIKHLDVGVQADIYSQLMNEKLFNNRPAKFFQYESGMNDADVLSKTIHNFKAFRLIRNFLFETTGEEITLEAWITDFFAEEIFDWKNSELALGKIKQKLLLFHVMVKDQVAWALTAKKKVDSNLELKMKIAGAKTLNLAELLPSPLQNQGANATLGTTVFWT